MKVFLSHPMSGLSEEVITKMREQATAKLKKKYGDVEIIDNYHHKDVPDGASRIWHLGTSIRMMEEADLIFFCSGYTKAKGCLVEKMICDLYSLKYEEEYAYCF